MKSENGLLLGSLFCLVLLTLEWKERKWHLPTAQGLVADIRVFFLACPIHVIFFAHPFHKLLKDFPENLPE